VSSYGCPWRCGFCSEQTAWKRTWLAVKGDRMADEIERLVKDYGVDTISFHEANFFVDIDRVRLFCEELIRRKLRINWCDADIRISQLLKIERDMWDLIVKSGCKEIFIGIESGYQQALDFIHKDTKVEEIITAFEKYQNSDVKLSCTVMGGLPWDTDYQKTRQLNDIDLKHTLALSERLINLNRRNRIVFWLFAPYPGCSLYKKSVEIGLKPPDSLEEWGNWLCELRTTPWVSPKQARKSEMLNYIFFFLDPDSCKWLSSLIRNRLLKSLFKKAFKLYSLIPQLRWKYHFFDLPIDYLLYQYIRNRQRLV